MSDTYCIYMHTNLVNGKRYIGQTKQVPEVRYRKDGTGYYGCAYFWNAIQKYGWDNFSHEILEEGLTENEANEKERFYIQKYNSTNKDFGYNMQFGGQDHREFTEDVKQKISASVKELWQDDEYVTKMPFRKGHKPFESNGSLGMHWYNNGVDEVLCMESDKPNGYAEGKLSSWNRGKHLTEEHKRAISNAQKGKTISEEQKQRLIDIGNKKAKKILCLETENIFNSFREAERVLGISHTSIARVCKGKYSQTNGYHFKYYKEVV